MAECVSCGKDIPAGKFFCEDCYFRMKGRRRPSGEVPDASAGSRDASAAVGRPQADTGSAPHGALPAGITPAARARADLTPAAGKKVVSMRPYAEGAGKEKAGGKRFTVTITFSERTYAALAKLRRGGKEKGTARADGTGGSEASSVRSRRATKNPNRRRRPDLKAVAGISSSSGREGGLGKLTGYRDRPMDRGDMAAMAMAAIAVAAIVILSFLPWARISILDEELMVMQPVEVKGADLGLITYACIFIAAAALLYVVASRLWVKGLAAVDFGVVLILAGIVIIPLFYASIASNDRFLAIALERLGRNAARLPEQYERVTLWPTYAMVIAGALLAFSGLLRLSERRGGNAAVEGR